MNLNRLAIVFIAGLFAACVLPSFHKATGKSPDAGGPAGNDAGGTTRALFGTACGLSDKLERACDGCIRKNCCDLAKACGDGTECGKNFLEPITPAASFSPDFDPLLGCMQVHCDEECHVNWGCLDNYSWPEPKGNTDVQIRVTDYADPINHPLKGVTAQACAAIDPACLTGVLSEGVTDTDGNVLLRDLPEAFNGFYSFTGPGYTPASVRWTEPVHRTSGFTQFQLSPAALSVLALITGVHKEAGDPFDPGLGYLIFRVQGCLPMRYLSVDQPPKAEVGNVRVEFTPNDGASPVFYTQDNGSVSVNLMATTTDGLGGAFNLLPRNVTVTAVNVATNKEVARGTINVQPGTIGFMWLVPRSKR